MGKLTVWLVIAVVAWFAWQAWRRAQRAAALRDAAADPDGDKRLHAPEPIVRCARCGVHLPASEAVHDGQTVFCSAAHRDAYRAALR